MARLNVAPTKSSLLALKRQLAFAEEGYDLLEQKRQILIFELMSRLRRADELEQRLIEAIPSAFAALLDAELDIGSLAVDRAAVGVRLDCQLQLTSQHLMGLKLPQVVAQMPQRGPQFGLAGTATSTDIAMRRFTHLVPLLVDLAELQNAVLRLARELRKTQRRCNALSRIFIPAYRETISYITSALEERERESFVILKMIRNRLTIPQSSGQAVQP